MSNAFDQKQPLQVRTENGKQAGYGQQPDRIRARSLYEATFGENWINITD